MLIALINTIVSLYYYLLVVKAMFIRQDDCVIESFKSHWTEKAGMIICVLGIVLLGIVSCVYTFIAGIAEGSSQLFSLI